MAVEATQTPLPLQYRAMLRVLEGIVKHRRASPTTASDLHYYELMLEYFQRLGRAREEGKTIAGFGIILPNEILYAMDIVPLHLELGSSALVAILNAYEEAFSRSKAFGLPPEMCSAHRALAAVHLLRWVPSPDVVVWSNTICSSCAKSGELVARLWDVPGFYLDRPYRWTPGDIGYFTRELEEMVAFLEDRTGKKLSWDRLQETLEHSARMVRLEQEIRKLRMQVPSPALNRYINQFVVIDWLYGGTPQGEAFARTVRDEMASRLAQGNSRERLRLVSLFPPPLYRWKLVDWMQKERGVSLVADPFCFHWVDWEPDPSRPLESLAWKCFLEPHCRTMHGPVEWAIEAAVTDALESRAQGAIYWAAAGCPQGCGMVRPLRDALRDRADLPTLVVDMEVNDPSFVPLEVLQEKLDSFFETLEG